MTNYLKSVIFYQFKSCTTFADCVADVVLQCTMVRMLSHVAQWLLLCETWHQHYHIHATYVSLHIFIHVAHNKYAGTNSSKANLHYQCNSFSLHICTDADQSLTIRFLNCRPAQCTVHHEAVLKSLAARKATIGATWPFAKFRVTRLLQTPRL